MITKSCGSVDYMTCQCGRHPQLMVAAVKGQQRYHLESICCRTITVALSTPERAKSEYQRIRAVQEDDKHYSPIAEACKEVAAPIQAQGRFLRGKK